MHTQLSVAQPHDIAPAHQSEGAPPQNNPTANSRGTAPPTDIGERMKPHGRRAIRVPEGGGHTHLQRVGTGGLSILVCGVHYRVNYRTPKRPFFVFLVPKLAKTTARSALVLRT